MEGKDIDATVVRMRFEFEYLQILLQTASWKAKTKYITNCILKLSSRLTCLLMASSSAIYYAWCLHDPMNDNHVTFFNAGTCCYAPKLTKTLWLCAQDDSRNSDGYSLTLLTALNDPADSHIMPTWITVTAFS
jgi:hypothetical protein